MLRRSSTFFARPSASPRRSLRSRLIARALLTAALLLLSTDARAQDPSADELQRARDLFGESERAQRAEKWGEALGLLAQVAAIKRTPGVLFHMANCEEHLGRFAAALEHFEAAEQLAVDQNVPDVKALAASRLPPLRQRVPRVTVSVRPRVEGLEVRLDGKPMSLDRLAELRMQPGEDHVIEARAPGRDPIQKKLHLAEGSATQLDIDLPETRSSGAVPSPATGSGNGSRGGGLDPDAGATRRGPPLGVIVAGGGAVALGIGGLVTFLVAGSENSSGEEACPSKTCDPSVRDTVRTLDRVSLVLWIGAGISAGAAATLWILDSRPARIGVAAAPGRVQVVGSF